MSVVASRYDDNKNIIFGWFCLAFYGLLPILLVNYVRKESWKWCWYKAVIYINFDVDFRWRRRISNMVKFLTKHFKSKLGNTVVLGLEWNIDRNCNFHNILKFLPPIFQSMDSFSTGLIRHNDVIWQFLRQNFDSNGKSFKFLKNSNSKIMPWRDRVLCLLCGTYSFTALYVIHWAKHFGKYLKNKLNFLLFTTFHLNYLLATTLGDAISFRFGYKNRWVGSTSGIC